MGKIGLIIRREYFTRIKNKTFIIMCLVGPLLWAALIIVPAMLAGKPGAPRQIVVVDMSRLSSLDTSLDYAHIFRDTMNLHFNYDYVLGDVEAVRKKYKDSTQTSVLEIPANFLGGMDSMNVATIGKAVILHSKNEPGHNTLAYIGSRLSAEHRKMMLQRDSIPIAAIEKLKDNITVANSVRGKVSKSEIKAVVGFVFGLIIYMYIFMYGVQVMRGVIEEKTTRIVEVIVSSVRPFQLMMGKIIGIMFVGLTQITIWIILSMLIITPIINSINDDKTDFTKALPANGIQQVMPMQDGGGGASPMNVFKNDETKEMISTIMMIPWGNMLVSFFFYFILGYLLYGAMFAAVGSAVDTESDTQQFMLPVTVPLIIAIALSSTVMMDPDGKIATWLSYIPFTSPITMMMRIPYSDPGAGSAGGVHVVDIIISIAILLVTFLIMTWLAGKIYRTGILMYGKKSSWKELFKWLFYKA